MERLLKFEDILSQWEEQEKTKSRKEKEAALKTSSDEKKRKDKAMDDWLEMYPPDRAMKDRKEKPDRIITHTRKKELARMEPQDILDLHGWTGQDALNELDLFLRSAKRRGLKKVMVIHGKGLHSPGGESVLRPLVKKHLEHSPLVRSFSPAKGRAGGGGASLIFLR